MPTTFEKGELIVRELLPITRIADDSLASRLETYNVPIYATDAEGYLTHFNRACVDFSGRQPMARRDRWCVTWRLSTPAGAHLPHEACPMAQAINLQRPVRGAFAIASTPQGDQRAFVPLPTPFFDLNGVLKGAINVFVDVTGRQEVAQLYGRAQQCRRLADGVDPSSSHLLLTLAADYEREILAFESRPTGT
jgi:PAS domain-containing protein